MATTQKCMIIGAVPIKSKKIFELYNIEEHFVICADAGYETALKFGIKPDLIVGDFDSAKEMPPQNLLVHTLPVEKDVTDTMYAAIKGVNMGFKNFVLLGCLGGERFDHSIANLQVLQYIAEHGCVGVMANEKTQAVMVSCKRLHLNGKIGDILSVFPMPKCNVTYKGLKYPLNGHTLTFTGAVMGVSNEIESEDAEITVNSGMALIISYST